MCITDWQGSSSGWCEVLRHAPGYKRPLVIQVVSSEKYGNIKAFRTYQVHCLQQKRRSSAQSNAATKFPNKYQITYQNEYYWFNLKIGIATLHRRVNSTARGGELRRRNMGFFLRDNSD